MSKCISFWNLNKNYLFILITLIFLLLSEIFSGFSIDGDPNSEVKIFDNGEFSNHILIHQMYGFFFLCYYHVLFW